jgi:ATP-dependent Clp protease ATP-binding subunit ClpX
MIIDFKTGKVQEYDEPSCSFCGKRKSQVKSLIASKTGKHICDKCVARCTTLINQPTEKEPA